MATVAKAHTAGDTVTLAPKSGTPIVTTVAVDSWDAGQPGYGGPEYVKVGRLWYLASDV